MIACVLNIQPAFADSRNINVFAASSLISAYTELGKRFQIAHPGIKISFSFQGSSTLATQIKAGAPADLFVSASDKDMQGVGIGHNYLVNRVVLAVPLNSKITKLTDLANVKWIQCAHEVPCGAAADSALKNANLAANPVSLEPKVSSATAKLLAGEVDAAIIYNSDVVENSKKLRAITFPGSDTTFYQISLLSKSHWARTFYEYLRSRAALKLLSKHGFEVIGQ